MTTQFQPGDIVERVIEDGLHFTDTIKVYGRYVVKGSDGREISLENCIGNWIAERFILIARGAGLELSQFINKGSQ